MIFDPELAAAAKRHARAQAKARQKAAGSAATVGTVTSATSTSVIPGGQGGGREAIGVTTTVKAPETASSAALTSSESISNYPSPAITSADTSGTSTAHPTPAKDAHPPRSVEYESSPAEKVIFGSGGAEKLGPCNNSTGTTVGSTGVLGNGGLGSRSRGKPIISRTGSGGDAEGGPRAGPVVSRSRMMKPRVLLKIVVLGSSNVGKTSIMKRYVASDFSERRRPTIGADFMTKEIIAGDQPMLLQIWDTAGQERFHGGSLGSGFFRGANAALLVYDVSCAVSFEQVAMWREELLVRLDVDPHDFPIVVIGNKVDLAKGVPLDGVHGVDRTRVLKWCEMQGMGHIETSAKDGMGVDAAMQAVAMLALDQKRKRERDLALHPSLGGGTILELADERARQQKAGGCCL